MSKNQLHGKKYEDHIKSAFSGSSDSERSPQSNWDIEKKYDKEFGFPTSIKTTKNNIVGLSDTRSFWSINESFRMLVGCYKQTNAVKEFFILYEFIISAEEHKFLLRELSYNEIEKFHNHLLTFKKGKHEEARIFAENEIKKFIYHIKSKNRF
ncbi:MAG: hypothetical protein QM536_09755 [Chitinophagaceae bacterium]|nr:hypothetical protein [Chitinophagaceae bacterium]